MLRTLWLIKRGGVASMYASELKMQSDKEQLAKNPIRNFCKSLVRRIHPRYPSTPPDQDDAATASAPIETCQAVQDAANRVIQQGTFDWGSFSAFADGSIELERAGMRQRFRDFSELKRNLNYAWKDEESTSIGTSLRSCMLGPTPVPLALQAQ